MERKKLKAYFDYFLPREVVGPVIIVFSLEGVISGLFDLYVPQSSATIGWGLIFVLSIILVGYWGRIDEKGLEELEERIEDMD
ncbi:hypothetical protein [Candidatus Nanohalovita haloferacivicina]|uniref:hypothetical protein n=1 Tax=Candidatus Nanohalovita haloferacivicina TaxID=2978046 RepID=UPI00325FC176|nr:putative membrane protein [Candidatus Nanohalobia archaeon BNXNv]